MEKREMLEALISYYEKGNKSRFAKRLGISAQGISTWLSRNTFDAELIYSKCEYVNSEWLLTGRGEMTKTNQPTPVEHMQTGHVSKNKDKEKNDNSQGLPPDIFDKLLSTIKEQQVTIKEQAEEIGILKHTIVQLKQESAGRVSGAESSTLAGVG